MDIRVDLEDLRACNNCGVIVDVNIVKRKRVGFRTENDIGICPVCKKEIYND